MPNGFVSPYVGKTTKEHGLIVVLVGLAINGVVYGATLIGVLWVLRSSDIVAWNISWHKSILLVSIINALRLYDKAIFQKK